MVLSPQDKIPFIKPDFPSPDELVADYSEIVSNNYYTNSGPFEKKFESEAAAFVGNKTHASVVANATTGLMLAVKATMTKDPGKDLVLIQSFTFAAGAEAIVWCGLKPVFIDIEQDGWQPDYEQARRYIVKNRNRIAGLLVCNTFGVGNQKIGDWEEMAREFSLPLVIDSAAGFGSSYSGNETVGARGNCEIFSLHATKPFAVGEGGLITSRDADFINSINQLKNFGFDESRQASLVGLNGKAPEITSAIASRQLGVYSSRLKTRQSLLSIYKEALQGTGARFQVNDDVSTVAFVSVAFESTDTLAIVASLSRAGIESRNYYNPPLHEHKAFMMYEHLPMDNTNALCSSIVSLPLHNDFSREDIERVVKNIGVAHA